MRYIKGFNESLSNKEIEKICLKYDISYYDINNDKSIDVQGAVYINSELLETIPLNFNRVDGDFDCSSNKLTSLKGSPKYVGGDFNCEYNMITTIEYLPKEIGGNLNLTDNKIFNYNNFNTQLNGKIEAWFNPINHIYNEFIKSVDNIELFNDFKIIEDNIINLNRLLSYNNINGYGEPNIERILLLGYIIK